MNILQKILDDNYDTSNNRELKPELRDELSDQIENQNIKHWDSLLGELSWKFTPTPSRDMIINLDETFKELKDRFIIIEK